MTTETSQPAAASIEELADIVTYLQRHLLRKMTRSANSSHISIPQFTILSYLETTGEMTMGQLASYMGHTTPATTGLIDRLTETGLVERRNAPEDRRKVLVSITTKGKQILQSSREEIRNCLSKVSERLLPPDRDAWLRIYRTLRDFCRELDETM